MKLMLNTVLQKTGMLNVIKILYHNIKGIPENIIVGGMECTGSTFVYQIVKEMGFSPKKVHNYYKHRSIPIVVTYRDPRDVICSFTCREFKEMIASKGIEDALVTSHNHLFVENKRHNDVRRYDKEKNCLLIRYENYFVGREKLLLDKSTDFLKVNVDDDLKTHLISEYSIKENKKRSTTLSSFREYDPNTFIHGDHISNDGRIGVWRDLFTPLVCEIVKKDIGDFLIECEYEKDLNW